MAESSNPLHAISPPPGRAAPRLIPVVDLMGGRAVRGAGGRRHEYRQVRCPRTGSENPEDVARTLVQVSGAAELYVADLDPITGPPRVSDAARRVVARCGVPVWLDAGIGRTDILDWPEDANIRPVVGFETCHCPEVLLETLLDPLRRPVAFSLDLKGGQLLGNRRGWGLKGWFDVVPLARRVVEMGVRTVIVLDLARVGTGSGTGTEPLLRELRAALPDVDLIAGGGVRSWADIDALGAAGANGVLVASALHDGSLGPRSNGAVAQE